MRIRTRGVALALVFGLAGCGGGGGGPATPNSPTPTPTPVPLPTPTPTPDPSPTPCTGGLCEAPVTNTNPVERVQLKLFQLFDANGFWIQPTPNPVQQVVREPIPVGYTIRVDVTGRDVDNKETLGNRGVQIEFFFSDPTMVQEQVQSDHQRKLKVLKPGSFRVYAVYDGVGSNDLRFNFVE
jgi:hypothetical protein